MYEARNRLFGIGTLMTHTYTYTTNRQIYMYSF